MTKRPNNANKADACCACGELKATPADHLNAGELELRVWQPNAGDPPQWICKACEVRLTSDDKRLT